MKKKLSTILLLVFLLINSLSIIAQAEKQTLFNNDEEFFGSVFIDPTFTDPGFQYGVEVLKEMQWFFVAAAVSQYPELEDGYTDLNFTVGMVMNFFHNQNLTIYSGAGGGANFRGGDPYGMMHLSLKLHLKIKDNVYLGLKFWVDHREDQKDEFYGDSDGHKKGLIFKGPLSQENGAGFITLLLN